MVNKKFEQIGLLVRYQTPQDIAGDAYNPSVKIKQMYFLF